MILFYYYYFYYYSLKPHIENICRFFSILRPYSSNAEELHGVKLFITYFV